ncbi:hypothetical protein CEXT_443111 [Caerostris extrusa]|uniref:Uncharacterized protein n=1 Tax=Caerostris extrusa TaxID=172846 RepID=A0AAV4NRV5_CAEEX|nr:hypothetical protein CEXT_443111 [Caerostris extrusa]
MFPSKIEMGRSFRNETELCIGINLSRYFNAKSMNCRFGGRAQPAFRELNVSLNDAMNSFKQCSLRFRPLRYNVWLNGTK